MTHIIHKLFSPFTSSISFFSFLILVISTSLSAGELPQESPESIAQRLQHRYDTMESLRFNFYQDTRGEMTGRPRRGSGWAAFYKKEDLSKMRWDYQTPDKQVLLSNGITFSMYFEKLQQMIITSAESLQTDLTYSFFTGKGQLQRDFRIHPADDDFQSEDRSESQVVKLIPAKPHAQVQDIHLWVTNNSLIRRIKIRDHFGTITVLNLSDIEPDGLKDTSEQDLATLFSFSPPQDTEIIHQ